MSTPQIWDDKIFRAYIYSLLSLYAFSGIYATSWISDQFDELRVVFCGFIAIPALTIFSLGFVIAGSRYDKKYPRLFWGLLIAIILSLIPSQLMLLNALGADQATVVSRAYGEMTINMNEKRGAFGWIYTTRW